MGYAVVVRELAAQPTASRRLTVDAAALEAELEPALLVVWAAMSAQQVPPAGPPYLRYHRITPEGLDIEAGFPVGAALQPTPRVNAGALPAGPTAVTLHIGPHDELRAAYAALAAWLEAHGYPPTGAPWESYLTDPVFTADQRTWRTEVLWPLP